MHTPCEKKLKIRLPTSISKVQKQVQNNSIFSGGKPPSPPFEVCNAKKTRKKERQLDEKPPLTGECAILMEGSTSCLSLHINYS
jgi:hypothetical protein